MKLDYSERIKRLPPYLFAEIEKLILEKKRQGVNLISLSIGDPDLPPNPVFIESLQQEIVIPENHRYSFSQGEPGFRSAVTAWYKQRFGVDLDSDKEVVALLGSKEGIANVTKAFVNPGDKVLVPDPSYPVYENGSTLLSDGVPVHMPLTENNNFKPDLENIKADGVKIMFLNYPNNPTSAGADLAFLKHVVEFARENSLYICYDNAYSEMTFDGYKAPSILEADGAMEVASEFHSLSKTFNITGDRIGFAVGNEQLIQGLTKVKTQIDSGPPIYVQKAAIKALESYVNGRPPQSIIDTLNTYRERRDILTNALNQMNLSCVIPKATFYVWANCGSDSMQFTRKLLDVGVVVTPGIGFGTQGEKHLRFAVTTSKEKISEACDRITKIMN